MVDHNTLHHILRKKKTVYWHKHLILIIKHSGGRVIIWVHFAAMETGAPCIHSSGSWNKWPGWSESLNVSGNWQQRLTSECASRHKESVLIDNSHHMLKTEADGLHQERTTLDATSTSYKQETKSSVKTRSSFDKRWSCLVWSSLVSDCISYSIWR